MDARKNNSNEYSESERELIEIILGLRNDPTRKSTFQLALQSARFHCGIEENGNIDKFTFDSRQLLVEKIKAGVDINIPSDEADMFSALLQYFICLEQMGTLFYIEEIKDRSDNNGIIKAINMFSPRKLSTPEKEALKNLRNSLGHAFGLVNVDMSRKKATHKFLLDFKDECDKPIKLPKQEWNGDYLDKSKETSTIVYVFPLIRFIEEIFANVVNKYKDCTLRFRYIEEIKARFTIICN